MNAPWTPISHSTSGKTVPGILHARERLGGMEGVEPWPDDPSILAARDRLSRIFRFYCRWPNELFLPNDNINALHANWSEDGFDVAEVVMEIEDLFDIEIPENDDIFRNLTYLEFIKRFLEKIPDSLEKYDAEAMQPFTLPEGYHAPGWWKSVRGIVTNRHNAWWFRKRQATRGGPWRNLWPSDTVITLARKKASVIIVEELSWFDDAFVPDDRLDALFLPSKGKRAGILRAVQRLNQAFPGAWIAVKEIQRSSETFGALIQRLAI